jgi:DNA-binding transcriptional LysR family regulator
LGVTQPAVSRAISDLEARIGFSLFDRIKGRLMPTPEGRLFFTDVNAAFIGLDSLRSSAARIRDFGSGRLRIASLAALGASLVPKAVRAFRINNPDIAITLQIASSSTVRDLVAHQQFDLGLAADEVDLSGVDHSTFASFRAVCAMPADHPLAEKDKITATDLHNISFIALSPEDRARRRISEVLDRAGVRPHVVVETPNSATICELALEGAGLGLVNKAATIGFEERGLVLKPFEPAVYFKSHILFRPDAQRARLVREFVAALNGTLRGSRAKKP